MNEEELHAWMINTLGEVQGELAWERFQELPDMLRQELLAIPPEQYPDLQTVQMGMEMFTNHVSKMADEGVVLDIDLAKNLAQNTITNEKNITAHDHELATNAMTYANLWLDATTMFNPPTQQVSVLKRSEWVNTALETLGRIATPVAKAKAQSVGDILRDLMGDNDDDSMEESGFIFAGPIPIQMPEGDGFQIQKAMIQSAIAIDLGMSMQSLSEVIRGSFDQCIVSTNNPSGAIIPENAMKYAENMNIDYQEVLNFVALREAAHARLFASTPWLMPRIEALLAKYANNVTINSEELREKFVEEHDLNAETLSKLLTTETMSIGVNAEQQEAVESLERLLAIIEGWVDCVVWRAGAPYLPHIEQLSEMMRREHATGGPAERTFKMLIGMDLHPQQIRNAANIWEELTRSSSIAERDHLWSHPDLLPTLPSDDKTPTRPSEQEELPTSTDWDAELTKLMESENAVVADNDDQTTDDNSTSAGSKSRDHHNDSNDNNNGKNSDNSSDNADNADKSDE